MNDSKTSALTAHCPASDCLASRGTLRAHGVNPFEYLRDVLVRVSSHPASDIDALLPHRWAPAIAQGAFTWNCRLRDAKQTRRRGAGAGARGA